MGNSLGAMVFIVAGIALGYWTLTGKANNFLASINGTGTQGAIPQGGSLQGMGFQNTSPQLSLPTTNTNIGNSVMNQVFHY